MASSLACGILWRFGAIIPLRTRSDHSAAPRSSVKNAMAGDAHTPNSVLLPIAWRRVWMWLIDAIKIRLRQIRDAPRPTS